MYYDSYVALYLRLSLEDTDKGSANDESNSIHSQKMLLNRFVESNPELQKYGVKIYIDDGYSGTNFDRPQFQELLKDIKKNKIYCIIVKDLSRFGRNYIEVGEYLEHIFPLLGIRFISINDNYDSDKLIGTTGGIEVAFKNLIHQKYSQDASEKVKAAMHLKMGKGQYVNHCPFGYTKEKGVKHKMIIDPITAPIVKEIFQLAISGMSSVQIAKHLNEKNTITPSQRKNSTRKINNDIMWSHQAVIRIIKDYKYTGAMVNFKCESETIRAKVQRQRKPDEWVVVENMHEPYVMPQDNGNCGAVKYLKLSNEAGNSFTVYGAPKFSFSAHNYTQKALHNAKHQEDLEFVNSTVLNIDGFMRGTGTNTCGPDTLDKYRVKTDKALVFKFAFNGE